MAKGKKGDWKGWVIELAAEAEAVIMWLLGGMKGPAPPVPNAIACIESGGKGKVTGNQTLCAAVILWIARPYDWVTAGPKMDHQHEAGWATPGHAYTGWQLADLALGYQLRVGLHGSREPWGYAPFYRLAYLGSAIHPETREAGDRLLWGQLAVLSLMVGDAETEEDGKVVYQRGVAPMGCRTPGTLLDDLTTAALELVRGGSPRIVKRDVAGRCLAAAMERGVLTPPPLKTVEDAVRVIRDSGVRCALGWEWYDAPETGLEWGARLERAGQCEEQRGVSGATVSPVKGHIRAVDLDKDGVDRWRQTAPRWLRLDEFGLALYGEWDLPGTGVPAPEPAEPNPTPDPTPPPILVSIPPPAPPGNPSNPYLKEAKARLESLKDDAKLLRRFRVEIHEIMVLLNKGGAW